MDPVTQAESGPATDLPPQRRSGPCQLRCGERVLLVDARNRRYMITLAAGKQFHPHAGILDHDRVIGAQEGTVVLTSSGKRFFAVRPTLADVILGMPRGAQVIYPKDLGAILMAADIAPGMRVLEAGVGSGALSMVLLRAGASVIGYELREDFARRAESNVAAVIGEASYRVERRDVYLGIEETELDRVLLDLPEPWRVVHHAETALRVGGILLCYLPTINQTAELRYALRRSRFGMCETFETMLRTWHVEGRSVRPDHRMVAHTGFLTHARLLASNEGTDHLGPYMCDESFAGSSAPPPCEPISETWPG